MRSISLEDCIVDGVNCIEVHICTIPPKKSVTAASSTIDISWNTSFDIANCLRNSEDILKILQNL